MLGNGEPLKHFPLNLPIKRRIPKQFLKHYAPKIHKNLYLQTVATMEKNGDG
jgi:hypothetical protein